MKTRRGGGGRERSVGVGGGGGEEKGVGKKEDMGTCRTGDKAEIFFLKKGSETPTSYFSEKKWMLPKGSCKGGVGGVEKCGGGGCFTNKWAQYKEKNFPLFFLKNYDRNYPKNASN